MVEVLCAEEMAAAAVVQALPMGLAVQQDIVVVAAAAAAAEALVAAVNIAA